MASSSVAAPALTDDELSFLAEYFSATEETVTFAAWVFKDKAGKKRHEDRLVGIGEYRLSTWRKQKLTSGLTQAREGHIIDLQHVAYAEVDGGAQITLKFPDFVFSFKVTLAQGKHMVLLIKNFYSLAQVGMPLSRFVPLSVVAASRETAPSAVWVLRTKVAFGGLVEAYEAWCAKLGFMLASQPLHRRLLDLLVQSGEDEAIELVPTALEDFAFLDAKVKPAFSLHPLAAALAFNPHYTSLTMSSIFRPDALDAAAAALRHNTTIRTLELARIGGTPSGAESLGRALRENVGSALTAVNLSHNGLKDRGVKALAAGLGALRSLRLLDLAFCQFSASGVSALARALGDSPSGHTLESLWLAGNRFGSAGTKALAKWLTVQRPAALALLDVSHCNVSIRCLAVALPASVLAALRSVHIAGASIPDKDQLFLTSALPSSALNALTLTAVRASFEALAGVAAAMVSDRARVESHLDLSEVKFGLAGAERLASALTLGRSLASLTLNDCALTGDGLVLLLGALSRSTALRRLDLSRNAKPRDAGSDAAIARLVAFVCAGDSQLATLALAGSMKAHFGPALVPLLDALDSAPSLTELDVSGNLFGDAGARALGASLPRCTRLRALALDDNAPSLAGLTSLAAGVRDNTSLVSLPIPNADFRAVLMCLAGATDGLEAVREVIQALRSAVRTNQSGRAAAWHASSLFGDPSEPDDVWLARDKAERRQRRAARHQARRAKRMTTLDGDLQRAHQQPLDRVKKRQTVALSVVSLDALVDALGKAPRAEMADDEPCIGADDGSDGGDCADGSSDSAN